MDAIMQPDPTKPTIASSMPANLSERLAFPSNLLPISSSVA